MKSYKLVVRLLGVFTLCAFAGLNGDAQRSKTAYSLVGLTFGQNNFVEVGLDGKVARMAPTGKDPHEVALSSNGRAYVSNTTEPSISVIDLKTFKEVTQLKSPYFGESNATSLPHGLDLSRDGNLLYITTERAKNPGVVVFDLKANSARTYIETGQMGGHLVRLHPKRDRAYVANSRSNSVSVIDTATNKLKQNISLPGGAMSIDFSGDGNLWVATNDGSVVIIDTDKETIQQQLTGKGKGNGRMRLSPDGRIAVVTHADGADVFDAKSRQFVTYFPVENDQSVTGIKHAIYVAFAPDGSVAYLSGINASSIFVIDLKTYKEVARWKLPVRVTTLDVVL